MELVSRDQWGANPAKSVRRIKTPVAELWLHHSASQDAGLRSVKTVQRFHQVNRGWADIAYNWVYSPLTGKFYEGRGAGVQGGHTQGRNSVSHALCVLGNYDTAGVSDQTVTDLQAFLKWHGQYGPTRFTGGHTDAPGANTACPGRNLHANLRAINGLTPMLKKAPATSRPVIRLWDKGPHVKHLQEELNRRGHNITADGRYGPLTQHAVTVFQRANRLKADGLVGPKTWRLL